MNAEILLEENMCLIHDVVSKFKHGINTCIDYEDLFNEAVIEFLNSIKKYDESKGVKFTTFAMTNMQFYMRNVVRRWNTGPKFSNKVKQDAFQFLKNKIDVKAATIEEIQSILGWKEKRIKIALDYIKFTDTKSLDKPKKSDKDGDVITMGELIGVEDEFKFEETEIMQKFLDTLKPMYLDVLRYQISGKTAAQTAEILGTTTKSVESIRHNILKKARKYREEFVNV